MKKLILAIIALIATSLLCSNAFATGDGSSSPPTKQIPTAS